MASSVFKTNELGLPAPDAISIAHSERLVAAIRARIDQSTTHTISFADFMRAALYEPSLGYYAAGATKLGAAGDFVTAPEMSALFGASLANAFRAIAANGVIELGAGSGALAASFLDVLPDCDYRILEVSADLRERQSTRLSDRSVTWLDALPTRITGLVIANEVLDAIPCEIVRFHPSHYEQARVKIHEGAFVFDWLPLFDGGLLDAVKVRVPPIDGYVSEINLEAEALVATLAERIDETAGGALCFIDYGFPRREFYMPDRTRGTLACHYRHRVHFDPLILLGLQDITAHVDFTAMAEASVDAGLQVIAYTSQAKFLLHAGLLQQLESQSFSNDATRIAATSAVQKLLSPSEMGELFKVLIVGRGAALESLASLADVDQSFRL
jgi:SAM-dependent MidA family methyltransferase